MSALEIHQAPEINIKTNPDFSNHCLQFTFKGKFTELASMSATASWTEHLDGFPNARFVFIWDCTDMTGFEIGARKEWYRALKVYKNQISEVKVVAKNLLIRGAARVMLEFFGFKGQIVRTFDELREPA